MSRRLHLLTGALAGALLVAAPLRAQTDYYNTDAGRPIRTEDAYATERYAFDLHLAPLTLARVGDGVYEWELEPEIAYGLLPRTQLELGAPVFYQDVGGNASGGLAGLDLSVLHNLNVETTYLPALGVRAAVLLPVGHFAPERAYPSVRGIATRTFRWARFHLNGSWTFGDEPAPDEHGAEELGRWFGGLAVDRTFPLRSLLVTAELVAEQPIHEEADLAWHAGTGFRKQLTPYVALDVGVGKRFTGDERPWFVTLGVARVAGIRALMPGR